MTRLRESDVSRLLELVSGAHAMLDVSEFRSGILGLVRQAIPCDIAAYNELETDGNRAVAMFEPAETMIFDDVGAVLARVAPSSPIITRYAETRDGSAYKLSDFLSQDELHETALWQEGLGPLGVEYQIAFALPSQPTVMIGITLNDGERDFGERDRKLLNLARPQLAQAYRNAQIHTEARIRMAALDRGLEAIGQAAILLRSDGRIRAASPQTQQLLAMSFGLDSAREGRLPADLERWVAVRRSSPRDAAHVPMVVRAGDERLIVRFVAGRGRADGDVLLLERGADPLSSAALCALGLTPRESEALCLAAMGGTSEMISREMSISAATTRKHFENVYRKLGVQSRAAAVAAAWAGAETKSMLD